MATINHIKDINIRGWDGSGNAPINIDKSTRAQTTIGYEHHEIHAGSHFFIENFGTFASGSAIIIAARTSATTKFPHVLFSVQANGPFELRLYGSGSAFTGGTTITAINNNQSINNPSVTHLVANPTIETLGQTIFATKLGASGLGASTLAGGRNARDDEIVLAPNSSYIWHIFSHDANVVINYKGNWYEHTDK